MKPLNLLRIRKGVVLLPHGEDGWLVMDETGEKVISSPLACELLGLILRGVSDEDRVAALMEDRFPLAHIYHGLNQLEELGLIVRDPAEGESPADLFRAKMRATDGVGYPPAPAQVMAVRILAVGGAGSPARALAASFTRSDVLRVENVSGGSAEIGDAQALHIVVTPDYLEPELEAFGRLAHERGLRWLPIKPGGVVPWIGPLFIPGDTGCIMCLLDRVKGHRWREVEEMDKALRKQSLRLSVGKTVHSFKAVAGLLAVELEKLAGGGKTDLEGAVSTLDFRSFSLTRHILVKRPQCTVCGTIEETNAPPGLIPEEPFGFQSRVKADYRDGGERVCSAVETLEEYSHLVSPVTGVVGSLTALDDIPSCFGQIVRSDWIVRGKRETGGQVPSGRRSALGMSTGKGRTVQQARASALGEAIERYSCQHEGYEPVIRASFAELGDKAIHPNQLMGFSEKQYALREALRQRGGVSYVPEPYDVTRPIDWTSAWSLTEERWRLIPSAFAYYSYPKEGGGDVCQGSSNGVAAGNCLEEAIMQGFFELVERDATAIWWYHRLLRPAVDWRSFGSPFVAAVDTAMDGMDLTLAVLDLTHDLGIPVFAANLFDRKKEERFKSIGLGCHHDPLIALERAVAELGQSWKLAERAEYSLRFQESVHSLESYLKPDPGQIPKTPSDFRREERSDFLVDIEDAVRLLKARGLDMLVMDMTRPDVGFPVARVMVPGLVHFWPRFGCRRLYDVPREAGWIGKDIGEDDLNPEPFFL